MPILGAAFYWRYAANTQAAELVGPIALFTIGLPLLAFGILKRFGYIESAVTVSIQQRIAPLILQTLFLFILLKIGNWKGSYPLYNFYTGAMISSLLAGMLLVVKVKASLHMIGMIGATSFLYLLSFYLDRNLAPPLILMLLLCGCTASSRLAMQAHTPKELAIGAFLGAFPQFFLVVNWV